jgi:hypothetical protein
MALVSISQVAGATPFDNTGTSFVSTNVQDALVEAATLIVPAPENFSFKNITAGRTVTIPVDQEMIVRQKITVRGQLIVRGELAVI